MKLILNNNIIIINLKKLFKIKKNIFIKNFKIILENYNYYKKNNILICHALSGSHHAIGVYINNFKNIGWFNNILNFKLNFKIICINNITSCYGSTNQNNKNPIKNKIYETNFPVLKFKNIIKINKIILKKISIKNILIIIGGSFGGMQILIWNIIYPNFIKFYICLAATNKLSIINKSYNEISKISINNNYKFYKNIYYNYKLKSITGLKLTRIIGHISYLSKYDFKKKIFKYIYLNNFKIKKKYFKISKYLNYQGNKFYNFFKTNSYINILKFLNKFNLNNYFKIYLNKDIKNFLVLCFEKDKRFNKKKSLNITKMLIKNKIKANLKIIKTKTGHDSFLKIDKTYVNLIKFYITKFIGAIGFEPMTL